MYIIDCTQHETEHITDYTVSCYSNESIDNIIWDFNKTANLSDAYSNWTILNNELHVEEHTAELLSKQYNNYNIMSFVFILADRPFNGDFTQNYIMFDSIFRTLHKDFTIEESNIFSPKFTNCKLLGVIEYSANKGWHFHILMITNERICRKKLLALNDDFNKIKIRYSFIGNNQENQFTFNTNVIVSAQIIKSPGSYFHYLRKDPKAIIANDMNLLKMFVNFERTHIFPQGTVPKFQKSKDVVTCNSKNPLVTLYMNMFSEGKLDFDSIMKDDRIQPFLATYNLRGIFENTFHNFKVNLNHVRNLTHIVNQFLNLNEYERCCCPILEFLEYQEIDKDVFMEQLFKWLNCSEKRNALWFYGPPDCGKSHLGRALWNCFALNKRITSDGIFSFAELDGAGCALWDEPFINAEMADQTKLILEGQSDVTITKKGKPAQKLNKRVPMIITSNNELSKYCSSDYDAFQVRTYRFNFYKQIVPSIFCQSDFHYCPFIDATNSEFNPFKNINLHKNKRRRTSEEGTFNCEGYHPILNNHAISFIVLTLVLYKTNFKLDKTIPNTDHIVLNDKLVQAKKLFCTCSRTLNIHPN